MALSFLQGNTSATDLTTYTFSGENLGTAAGDRYIIVGVAARAGATGRSISSITVGGVSATISIQGTQDGAAACCVGALAIAAVPTGTTGDVVVTFSGGMLRCAIQLYRATGLSSATPSDTDSDVSGAANPTVNLDVPAGGFAIGSGVSGSSSGGPVTWTGLTEDYDAQIGGEASWSTSASQTFVAAQTGLAITITMGTKTDPVGVFASWGLGGGFIDNTSNILRALWGGASLSA